MVAPFLAAALIARRARQRASAAATSSSSIPPPRSKPGDHPASRGRVSSGKAQATLRPHPLLTARSSAPTHVPPPGPMPSMWSKQWPLWHIKWQVWFNSLPLAEQHRMQAEADAIVATNKHAAASSRPDPFAGQPADQSAWLNQWMLAYGSVPAAYPEWQWAHTGNGGEARALVQRGPNDWVHWYVAPSGDRWSYEHDWGSGFDLGHAAQQAAGLVAQGARLAQQAAEKAGSAAAALVHTVAQPFTQALEAAGHLMDQELDQLASALPPQVRPLLEGLKKAEHFVLQFEESAIDPTRIDWRQVAHDLEAATSTVPVLGTALADVVATAEVLYDAVTSTDPLEAALRAAYDYALASAPGAAELRQFIDPVFDLLVRIVVQHQKPTAALVATAVDQAPTSPQIGALSPRSVAASLAAFVVSKMGMA